MGTSQEENYLGLFNFCCSSGTVCKSSSLLVESASRSSSWAFAAPLLSKSIAYRNDQCLFGHFEILQRATRITKTH